MVLLPVFVSPEESLVGSRTHEIAKYGNYSNQKSSPVNWDGRGIHEVHIYLKINADERTNKRIALIKKA